MHESRMMADVVPPGCCAMPNVSGSRMATPFAPPRPGSTPMMMPSTTPMNISSRLNGDSATPNPCINALISSMRSAQPERSLERPLGQGHPEPGLENEEERDVHADRHGHDLEPGVLA